LLTTATAALVTTDGQGEVTTRGGRRAAGARGLTGKQRRAILRLAERRRALTDDHITAALMNLTTKSGRWQQRPEASG